MIKPPHVVLIFFQNISTKSVFISVVQDDENILFVKSDRDHGVACCHACHCAPLPRLSRIAASAKHKTNAVALQQQ